MYLAIRDKLWKKSLRKVLYYKHQIVFGFPRANHPSNHRYLSPPCFQLDNQSQHNQEYPWVLLGNQLSRP